MTCIYLDKQTDKTGCDEKYPKCFRCGFEDTEHRKRIARGLVQDSNGLWHYVPTQEAE